MGTMLPLPQATNPHEYIPLYTKLNCHQSRNFMCLRHKGFSQLGQAPRREWRCCRRNWGSVREGRGGLLGVGDTIRPNASHGAPGSELRQEQGQNSRRRGRGTKWGRRALCAGWAHSSTPVLCPLRVRVSGQAGDPQNAMTR